MGLRNFQGKEEVESEGADTGNHVSIGTLLEKGEGIAESLLPSRSCTADLGGESRGGKEGDDTMSLTLR